MNTPPSTPEQVVGGLARCLVILATSVLGACLTFDSYLDPAYTRYSLEGQAPGVLPERVGLRVRYQANDVEDPVRSGVGYERIRSLIERSGVSSVISPEALTVSDPVLVVDIDHRFDAERSFRAGMVTGMAMGSTRVKNSVRDEFSVALKLIGGDQPDVVTQGLYEHAIVTTMTGGPPGIELIEYEAAFDRVMDDALARFVHDRRVAETRPTPVIVLPEPPDLSEGEEGNRPAMR